MDPTTQHVFLVLPAEHLLKLLKSEKRKLKVKNNDSPKTETVIEKTGIIISIGKTALKEVTETKFLGIIFNPILNWNAHIKHLKSKLETSFAIIKRISPYVTSNNYKQVYHTLFESHLTYCIPTWGGAKKKLIDQIFTLQKLAVRYLFGDTKSSVKNSIQQRVRALLMNND